LAYRQIEVAPGRHWDVDARVVIPDHVHLLVWRCVRPNCETHFLLSDVMHSVESFSVHGIAKRRGRAGSVRQDERSDRTMRDQAAWEEKLEHIANNPVKRRRCADYLEYSYFSYSGDRFGEKPAELRG
jgi:hypothetical protein